MGGKTEKKKRLRDRHRMLIAVAANLLILAVCTFFLVPEAINNDDYIIHSITSGAYGEASPELAHTNILYGKSLVLMQRIFPGWNWFELIIYAMLFLSVCFLSYRIWIRSRTAAGVLLALTFALFVGPQFYLQLHNSKAVPFIAAAGLFAVFYGYSQKQPLFCVYGGVLAVIAAFVRFHAFLMGAAFAFVICVLRLFSLTKEKDRKKALREAGRMVLAFGLVFAVVFGTYLWDVYTESKDETLHEYRVYNMARGAVSDYELPDYAENYAALQEMGISENDYQMIRNWDFADPEKFTAETLTAIAGLRGSVSRTDALKTFLKEIFSGLTGSALFFGVFVLTLVGILFTGRKEAVQVLGLFLMFLLCLLYMCLGGRTTRWVTAGLAGAALAGLAGSFRWRKGSLSTVVSIVLLVAVILFDCVTLIPRLKDDYDTYFNRGAMRIYTDLGSREENLYLMDHNCSPPLQRTVPTFSAVEKDLCRNVYVLGGWDTGSDAKNSILDRYSVYRSPFRALLEKRNVFLADMGNAPTVLKYLRENYSPNASMALVETVDGYYIYAFSSQRIDSKDTSVELLDASAAMDTQYGNYLYAGAVFDTDVKQWAAVYIELTDRNGVRHLYRTTTLERDDGHSAAVTWAPLTDFPDISGLRIRVLVETRFDEVRASGYFGEEPAEEPEG